MVAEVTELIHRQGTVEADRDFFSFSTGQEPAVESDLQDLHELRNKRPREEPKMDITPMIDVTFLLLIFFVVASKMDPQMAVDLPTTKHGDAIPEDDAVVMLVIADSIDDPSIFRGLSKAPENRIMGSIDEQEAAIRAYIEEELNGASPKRFVLIKAEREVRYRHMDRVYRAVKEAIQAQGDVEIHTAVIEEI